VSPWLYAWLIGAITIGAVVAGSAARAAATPRLWPSVAGLGGLIAALLLVGVVSGTLVRHVIQLAPAMVALTLVGVGSPSGRAAALPILLFWAVLMAIIWAFLLGLHRVIGGHFTTVEIILTVAIGVACAAGFVGGPRPTANLSATRRVAIAAAFGLCQLAAFWYSLG
jgi:hypothetical protein